MTTTDGSHARRAGAARTGGLAAAGRGVGWILLGVMLTAALAAGGASPAAAALQPSQPPVEEFVPIDQLPEEDRLPAAPFLIAAYSIVWILAFGYFWSLTRRMEVVERDLAGLARRVGDRGDEEQP
ncbi:MAG: CcmD family protein [Acidobacteria bacterium]|nr:CcmD family protein [Acidobacteriota bacterium]